MLRESSISGKKLTLVEVEDVRYLHLYKLLNINVRIHCMDFGPCYTSITLKICGTLNLPVLVNQIVEKNGEFLLPFVPREEGDFANDRRLVVVGNFGDDGRTSSHAASGDDIVCRELLALADLRRIHRLYSPSRIAFRIDDFPAPVAPQTAMSVVGEL